NPCPCGFAGDPLRECRCTPQQVVRYRSRLSGPLRDRLDLTVDVPALPPNALGGTSTGEASAVVGRRVVEARRRQRERYRDHRSGRLRTNAELTSPLMAEHCALDQRAIRLLDAAVRTMGLSARGFDRVRKVARTIADLAAADGIRAEDVAEALQFRM